MVMLTLPAPRESAEAQTPVLSNAPNLQRRITPECALASNTMTQESGSPAQDDEVVPLATLWRAFKVVCMIAAAAAAGAVLVAFVVLGTKLPLGTVGLGVGVAFFMIMFIGMPLTLASIQDALEPHA